MSVIVPTVTASDPHHYREQIERITPFAERIHIDLADGTLAPTKLLDLEQIWLPEHVLIDFHIMSKRPQTILADVVALA